MKIIKLNAIDSTNSYLKEANKQGQVEDKTFVWAQSQTNGRGQMGAIWQSKVGNSLTFSLLKRFSTLKIEQQAYLLYAVALAVKKALVALQIPAVSIKWPNDIMSYHKKVGGILIENQTEGTHISMSVIGIGINVNDSQLEGLPQASSLYLSSGVQQNIEEVFKIISEALLAELQVLETAAVSDLKVAYERSLFRKDDVSVFEDPSGKRSNGIIRGVSETGQLLVEDNHGQITPYQLKQIKLLF